MSMRPSKSIIEMVNSSLVTMAFLPLLPLLLLVVVCRGGTGAAGGVGAGSALVLEEAAESLLPSRAGGGCREGGVVVSYALRVGADAKVTWEGRRGAA